MSTVKIWFNKPTIDFTGKSLDHLTMPDLLLTDAEPIKGPGGLIAVYVGERFLCLPNTATILVED